MLLKQEDLLGKRVIQAKKGKSEMSGDEVADFGPLKDKTIVTIDPNMSDLLDCAAIHQHFPTGTTGARMRNLVSLRRQLWPLHGDTGSQQTCTSFALNGGESQAFFLREDGRIDIATLEEDGGANAPVELLVDMREFIPMQEDDESSELVAAAAAASGWKWIDYVAELDVLACAHSNGTLAVVDVNARVAEEIGAMDGGICGVAWSSNQEMVAVVTGVGTVLVMNTRWEVLHETQLDAFLPPDATRKQEQDTEIAVCWREDSQFLVVNVPVVSGGRAMQKVMVFTGQLDFHALGRLEDGRAIPQLGATLDWCPNHSLITSSETRKEQLFVVFFERNGLRHGEFALPAEYRASSFRVTQVGWNIDSDMLAVALESTVSEQQQQQQQESIVQLWTRSNYHWYLKQERRLHVESKRLVHFKWDDERANQLHLLTLASSSRGVKSTAAALLQEEFVWDVSRGEREVFSAVTKTNKSIVVASVIDGNKLLLTPLHQALVPPPMALHQVEFSAAINSVVFDSQTEVLAALLSNGDLVVVENYLSSAEKSIVQPEKQQQQQHGDQAAALTSLQWMRFSQQGGDAKTLSLVAKSGWNDALVVASVDSLSSTHNHLLMVEYPPALEGVRRATEVVNQFPSHEEEGITNANPPTVAIQTHDGTVYTISPLHPDQEECEVTELSDRYPAFAQLLVIATKPESEHPSNHLVLGLQTTSKLYVNDKLIVPACSTFRYCPTASVLLFTTLGSQAQLRMVPLEGLKQQKLDVYESRMVERGAKLVAVVGDRANVVVQMPRGNLECMAPRLLVLALAIKQIEQLQYVAALEMCRKHRLDLNLLVDFASQSFLANFPQHLVRKFLSDKPEQITSDRLCLFITNLHPVDVWTTKYLPQVAPFIDTSTAAVLEKNEKNESEGESDKVNVVCQAIMQAVREIEGDEQCGEKTRSALLLPFLTAAVKQSPPQYTDALVKIQALLQQKEQGGLAIAKRAIKHLILLTQVDVLYDEALGLYDIELVRFIATYSQRDPKEYVPFLDELSRMTANADLLKYTIDLHLSRHKKALVHVSALILSTSDAEKKAQYEEDAIAVIKQGVLYDQAIALFPSSNASPVAKAFQRRLVLLKGEHLEATNQHEAAAYVYLSESACSQAQAAFLAAGQWQMGLSLALKAKQSPADVQRLAYQVAEKLLSQKEAAEDVLPVARIYVEYCKDIDEAVALLVTNKLYEEALRIAYLHKREDLVVSDIESGVLQAFNDIIDEISTNSAAYLDHWKRLTTIREQKRLFKLHGIDGSRWQQDGAAGDGDDAQSVYSGAPSAADSALSNASMRSVGSHNSALSIGNFAMKTLAQATSSHFYATQTLGGASSINGGGGMSSMKPQKKVRLSRNERRNKIKKGSAEEEQFILQQCVNNQPSATLKKNVKALLQMLVLFGHVKQAQTLQSKFSAFEHLVDVEHLLPQLDASVATSARLSKIAGGGGEEGQHQRGDQTKTKEASDSTSAKESLAWRLAALQNV